MLWFPVHNSVRYIIYYTQEIWVFLLHAENVKPRLCITVCCLMMGE